MKLSILLAHLNVIWREHGDHEVYLEFPPDDSDGECEINRVYSHHLHRNPDEPIVTCITGLPEE